MLSLSLEEIAALGVLLANGVFVIVAVAAYLRMNSQEDRRQRFLNHALGDSRESGQALKSIVRDLQRLMERMERAALGRGAQEPAAAAERSRSGRALNGEASDSALPGSEEEQMDFARLSPPEQCPTIGDYAEWRRLQQVELARLLQQRRQLLQALDQARAANSRRSGAGSSHPESASGNNQRGESLELQRTRQRLAELQAELERSQVERSFVEDRLLDLDEALTREKIHAANLQRRIETLERAAAAVEA